MKTKSFDVAVKAAGEGDGLKAGQVRMLVSAFGNVDSYGDVVMPGAFADDLAAWGAKGDPIPFIWSHQWSDPFAHIGYVVEAAETADGLEVLAQLDVAGDESWNAKARKVYELLKGRRVTQASFAYDVLEGDWAEREDAETGKKYEVYELRKMHVIEVGPTLIGANRDTDLLAAKALEGAAGVRAAVADAKAGKVLSAKNYETLSAAHAAIGEVLAGAEDSKGDSVGVADTGSKRDSEAVAARAKSARARLALVAIEGMEEE